MKQEKSYLITKMKEVISKIAGFSEKDLVGFSEAEYKLRCANETK